MGIIISQAGGNVKHERLACDWRQQANASAFACVASGEVFNYGHTTQVPRREGGLRLCR